MREPTTLLLLTNRFPYGTGEEYLEQEITYLARTFDRILVAPCMRAPTGQPRKLPSNATALRAPLPNHRRETLSMAVQGARSLGCMGRHARHPVRETYEDYFVGRAERVADALEAPVRDALGGATPDVIYSYWFYLSAQVATELRKRCGWQAPLVSRAHGYDINVHASPVNHLPQRKHLLRECDFVWPVSSAAASDLRSAYPQYAHRIQVRRLGTPAPLKAPVASREELKIVTCSMIRPLKRLDVVQEAVRLLRERGYAVEWLHIGAGTGRYSDKLKERASCTKYQRFTGYVENSEIFSVYIHERPTVFLNVSSSEGVPVSAMEAMACGIPVLATNVGGTAELLGPLGDGSLLPAGIDAADLASAIQSEILDPADHAYRALSERTMQQWEQIASADAIYTSFSEEVRALARHS